MAVTAAALVTAAIGAGMAISGAIKKGKANKLARNNKRPEYTINQEEMDNLNLAESLASQGMSESSKQYLTTNAERGLTTSIDAILKGGGDINAINKSYDVYNQNLSRVALADFEAQRNNIGLLVAQRNRMSDQRDKEWQINKYAPYADKAQAAKEMAAAGDAQMWQGISTVGSAVGSMGGAMGGAKNVAGVNSGASMRVAAPAQSAGATGAGIGIGGGASNNYGLGTAATPAPAARTYNSTTGTFVSNGDYYNNLTPEARASLNSLIGNNW